MRSHLLAQCAVLFLAGACGSGSGHVNVPGGSGGGGGSGGSSSAGGGTASGTGGGLAGAGGGGGSAAGTGGGSGYSADSFFTQCSGVSTLLNGVALAPNGTDPISGAEIAVWDHAPTPLPTGVACEKCDAPGETPLASTIAATNGVFSLSLDYVKKQPVLYLTVKKARFRRVVANFTVTACTPGTVTAAQSTLPKNATEGDMPKIAVSSGNRDHLEKVVNAMGITDYDCVKGLSASSSAETCTRPVTLGALLGDLNALKAYGLLFISCAPANTYEPSSPAAVAATNLKAWVALGGKLVVTDESYDFVEQVFPDAIEFAGSTPSAGVPQPENSGEVGTSVATVTGTVSDPGLAAWLKLFPNAINATNQVSLQGFLTKWGVQKSAGVGTDVIVHGVAPFSGATADVPLTTRFEVGGCGRVIYSSYHTDSGTALLPQERILEYLMFEVATCTRIN